MTKPIIWNLPHPDSGYYADMRLTARIMQGTGGVCAFVGLYAITKSDSPFAGLIATTYGIACTVVGIDICKGLTNLENLHKKNFNILDNAIGVSTQVDKSAAIKAATEGLFLQNVYRDLAAVHAKNLQVYLLSKKHYTHH